MTIDHSHCIASDGYTTTLHSLEAHDSKGVVIVFHGMMEHGARYEEFAEFLYAHHYHTIIADLRCFGTQAAQRGTLGHLEPNQGFNQLMQDAEELVSDIKERYPTLPVFIFGHSFGSLIARRIGQTLGHTVAGIIASGPPTSTGLLGNISEKLVERQINQLSSTHLAERFGQLVFGRYNLRFFPALSKNAWLSSALASIYQHPRHLPLLLIAGGDDPVAFDGKGIHHLFDMYNRVRVDAVQLTIYKGLRHELFHEFERIRVFADIASWLNKQVNPAATRSSSRSS